MSKLTHILSSRIASLAAVRLAFPALLLGGTLSVLTTGCGSAPAYVYVGPPCYGYGCGYGYGYGYISTFAGNGIHGNSGNGGSAVQAQLNQPVAVTVDPSGNLFIADSASNTIREVPAGTGLITAALMTNAATNPGAHVALVSSIATSPSFNHPTSLALDPSGNLYVLDRASSVIHRVSASTGTLALVAGSPLGRSGYSGDNGLATAAQLSNPSGMAFDPSGNLFIADTGNHRIREVAASTGLITTVAGTGTAGFSGDGGPATAALLSNPSAIAADSKGNLYIADSATSTVREIDARTGLISTVAGTGTAGFSGDGAAATAAKLNSPEGITVDSFGNLFITDTGNQRIREVATGTGIISTIAGNSTQGYSGDGGPSSHSSLNSPYATAVDTSGNLYIADSGNGVVRKVLPNSKATQAAN